MDQKKGNEDNALYGDLIIWKELIAKARSEKKPMIFITDDQKEDWWFKIKGVTTPRPELIKEFKKETGSLILIYQADNFIEHAKTRLLSSIKSDTIKEIKNIRVQDEKFLESYLSPLARIQYIDGQNVLSLKDELNNQYANELFFHPRTYQASPSSYSVLNPDGSTSLFVENNDKASPPSSYSVLNPDGSLSVVVENKNKFVPTSIFPKSSIAENILYVKKPDKNKDGSE